MSIFIKKYIKKYFITLFSISMIIFFAFLTMNISISSILDIEKKANDNLENSDYGSVSIFVRGNLNIDFVDDFILSNELVKSLKSMEIIYSNYGNAKKSSDVSGRIFCDIDNVYDLDDGEIAVPISIMKEYNTKIFDNLELDILSSEKTTFKIKNAFYDPIFGSTMIGLKRFYVNEKDFEYLKSSISKNVDNATAYMGCVFFIEGNENANYEKLIDIFYSNPNLSNTVENVYSKDAIVDFETILVKNFLSILFIFSLLLFIISTITCIFNITNIIEEEHRNIIVMSIIGISKRKIVNIFLFIVNLFIFIPLMISYVFVIPIENVIYKILIYSNGYLYDGNINFPISITLNIIIALIINIFVINRLNKICDVKPQKNSSIKKNFKIVKWLLFIKSMLYKTNGGIKKVNYVLFIAIRELLTRINKYCIIFMISILFAYFIGSIMRINTWLSPTGRGLMNAFNPTDMDIGVQIVNDNVDFDIDSIKYDIEKMSEVQYEYMLGMSNLLVDNINFRTNVSSDPYKYHLLNGSICENDNEVLLTEIVAKNLSKNIGDTVKIKGDKGENDFVVSGIYECANEMGDNIGLSKEGFEKVGSTSDNFYCHHYFLKYKNVDNIIDYLNTKYGESIHVHSNTWSGLDSIVKSMYGLIIIILVLTIVIIYNVCFIQIKSKLIDEKKNINIYKLIGINNKCLIQSFTIRFFIMSTLGTITGFILIILTSDSIIRNIMKIYGICSYSSNVDVLNVLMLSIIIIAFTSFSYMQSLNIIKIKLEKNYK